jgi:hypothetical protein
VELVGVGVLHAPFFTEGRTRCPVQLLRGRKSGYALSKNISKTEHQHRDLSTSLRFGRDDKGEGDASKEGDCRTETDFHHLGWAAGP